MACLVACARVVGVHIGAVRSLLCVYVCYVCAHVRTNVCVVLLYFVAYLCVVCVRVCVSGGLVTCVSECVPNSCHYVLPIPL